MIEQKLIHNLVSHFVLPTRCMGGKWSFVFPELQHLVGTMYAGRQLWITLHIAKTKVQVRNIHRWCRRNLSVVCRPIIIYMTMGQSSFI